MVVKKNRLATSEYNITYLIGAGASANALPLVKATKNNSGLSQAFLDLGEKLMAIPDLSSENIVDRNELYEGLQWLSSESDKHGTTDTFAKHLYLQNKSELVRLKYLLSFYFTYEQLIEKRTDRRYSTFLTSVLEFKQIMPTNINIISWNYDCQFQLAAENFKKEEYIVSNPSGVSMHSPPLLTSYPGIGRTYYSNHENSIKDYQLLQLNGIAGYYMEDLSQILYSDFLDLDDCNLAGLINAFNQNNRRKQSLISFAWEHGHIEDRFMANRMSIATYLASKTHILVVIGYSFPFFNRKVDQFIFDELKTNPEFKKIYFQDPVGNGDFLRKQFRLDENIEIINIENVETFYLPNEL